jgi:hypothetical protein
MALGNTEQAPMVGLPFDASGEAVGPGQPLTHSTVRHFHDGATLRTPAAALQDHSSEHTALAKATAADIPPQVLHRCTMSGMRVLPKREAVPRCHCQTYHSDTPPTACTHSVIKTLARQQLHSHRPLHRPHDAEAQTALLTLSSIASIF